MSLTIWLWQSSAEGDWTSLKIKEMNQKWKGWIYNISLATSHNELDVIRQDFYIEIRKLVKGDNFFSLFESSEKMYRSNVNYPPKKT